MGKILKNHRHMSDEGGITIEKEEKWGPSKPPTPSPPIQGDFGRECEEIFVEEQRYDQSEHAA